MFRAALASIGRMPARLLRLARFRRPPTVALNLGLAVLAVAGAGWAYQLVRGPAQAAAATTGLSRTVPVSQGDVVQTASASGSVQSATTATADFVTSGTVTSIAVKVGDAVKKGAVLARVDATQQRAQLDAAEANLTAAQASLDRADTSGDDTAIATAQAQVTSARAAVTEAERAVSGTVLKAPMAGTVTAVNGSVGGTSNGSTGFVQLADLGAMQVSASFAEADATKLKTGQTATVTWAALAGATAQGTVASIAPTASTTNNVNSYAVIVSLGTLPTGIRMGQTVTASVTVAQATNVVRVPAAAVRALGNGHVVTVVGEGTNQVRRVEVGVEGDSFTEITSGLTVGEQVQIVTSATTGTNGFPGGGFLPGGGVFQGGGGGGGGGRGNNQGGGGGTR
jgi:macrolide-specific efflux system membrane fusion protein